MAGCNHFQFFFECFISMGLGWNLTIYKLTHVCVNLRFAECGESIVYDCGRSRTLHMSALEECRENFSMMLASNCTHKLFNPFWLISRLCGGIGGRQPYRDQAWCFKHHVPAWRVAPVAPVRCHFGQCGDQVSSKRLAPYDSVSIIGNLSYSDSK